MLLTLSLRLLLLGYRWLAEVTVWNTTGLWVHGLFALNRLLLTCCLLLLLWAQRYRCRHSRWLGPRRCSSSVEQGLTNS